MCALCVHVHVHIHVHELVQGQALHLVFFIRAWAGLGGRPNKWGHVIFFHLIPFDSMNPLNRTGPKYKLFPLKKQTKA